MAKILTSYHPPFIPILKRLAVQGHELITAHPTFTQQLVDMDVPVRSLRDYVDGSIQSAAMAEAARLLCVTKPPKNSLGPGAIDYMTDNLGAFLYPRLGEMTTVLMAVDKIKPDLILLHNDVEPLTRTFAAWASAHSVPALHIPHAVYLDIDRGEPGSDIHDIVTASHLAVAGWFQRDWYSKRGATRIADTGLPQFDKITRMKKDPLLAKRQLGLEKNRPVVTYASSWRQDTNLLGSHDGVEETYNAMLQVMKRLPNIQWVIKLHPRAGSHQWHADRAKEAGVKATITAAHLESCLQASDLMMCYSGSNVLLEGSLFPWLRMACTAGYADDPEIVKINTDPPDIEVICDSIMGSLMADPPNYTAFQAKYIGRPDGLASERIAELVGGLFSG